MLNIPALCPDPQLWLPPEICSPHQNFVWEHFLENKKRNSTQSQIITVKEVISQKVGRVEITIKNLLYSLIPHLSSGEPL